MESNPQASVKAKPRSFAELIRSTRQAEHLTLAALASRLGMSVSNLSDLEQGRRLPGPKRAIVIANCLGLPPADLVALALENLLDRQKIPYSVSLTPKTAELGTG